MSASPAAVVRQLGGKAIIKAEIRTELDLVNAVRRGLPVQAARNLVRQGILSVIELETLVVPRRTLQHRARKRQPLSAEQSDRVARFARVTAFAAEMIGDEVKAHRWLRQPSRALGGGTPLSLLDTEGGARLVEDELVRIAHGVFA